MGAAHLLTLAWTQAFAAHDAVDVASDDFFARDADALVSPRTAFGVMDRLNRAIRATIGGPLQKRVQDVIFVTPSHGGAPLWRSGGRRNGHQKLRSALITPLFDRPLQSTSTFDGVAE